MKKFFPLLLLSLLFVFQSAQTMPMVSVLVDGQVIPLSQRPIINNGRVLVPLRGVFEQLGAAVSYNPSTRTITAVRTGTNIMLTLESQIATVNGASETLDTTPMNLNGVVLVPLRFVSESLGALVSWMPNTRTVNIVSRTGGIITTSPTSIPPVQTGTALITGISLSPQSAKAGDTVTITLTGSRGGMGIITLSNGQRIALTENAPGTYTGAFTVPNGLTGNTLDVTSSLTMPNGQLQTLTTHNALILSTNGTTLPGGVLPFQVITPNPAAIVPQVFDLTGTTQPNALVRLGIVANNKEIVNTQTFADGAGNFHFSVNTGNIKTGAVLNVEMHSENLSGQMSDIFRMQLEKQ